MTEPEHASRPLRLLVVDDHEVVRQGLVALLERRRSFQVVAEAGTVAEAIEQARRFQPDLVIMDVRLPDGSGIEACREIRAELPATRVVMLTSLPGRGGRPLGDRRRRLRLPAQADPRARPRRRPRGRRSGRIAARPGGHREGPRAGPPDRDRRLHRTSWPQLTAQEQKILLLVAEGKTNKEIAAEVFLSDKTVKNYVSSILSKLNLERRAQAAAFVAKHRIGTGGSGG